MNNHTDFAIWKIEKGIVYFGAVKYTADTPDPKGANIFICTLHQIGLNACKWKLEHPRVVVCFTAPQYTIHYDNLNDQHTENKKTFMQKSQNPQESRPTM